MVNRALENHPRWKGGRYINYVGYVFIKVPNHPRASGRGYVFEHILVMEKAIGRFPELDEVVHHLDGNKQNNNIGNLILFKTGVMHTAFHQRLKAFHITGHWDWLSCPYCHQYDDPKNLTKKGFHKACRNAYRRTPAQRATQAEYKRRLRLQLRQNKQVGC